MLCLLAASLSLQANSDHAVDRNEITHGVTALVAPGALPGQLSVSGDAFVVLTGSAGKAQAPLAAAAKVERGRAIAVGHEGFFSDRALQNPGNGRFVGNALTWLGRKPLQGLRVGLLDMRGLSASLTAAGAVPGIVNSGSLQSALSNDDVICMTQDALDDNPSGQIAVMRFVKAGHGLLIAGPGWGWVQTHPRKDLLADQTANRMLVPFGITFEPGTLGKEFSPTGADSPLFDPQSAIAALTKGGLSLADTATATSSVQRSLAHQSSVGSSLVNQIISLAKAEKGGGIPTAENPITTAMPFSRLKIALDQRNYERALPNEIKPDPSAATFPGPVGGAAPRIRRTVAVDTSIPAWHGTGLYAAPGEVITVAVPTNASNAAIALRIGAQTDTLWELDKWPRFPQITTYKRITTEETQVASPFGGLIYIDVPYNCRLGPIQVRVENAVMAPRYVKHQTTEAEWQDMVKKTSAPWAEIEGDLVTLIVPIKSARKAHSPAALMAYWDDVMTNAYSFFAAPKHARPERYCPDVEISAGYMHSGYPIMTHIDVADTFCDLFKLTAKGYTWGFYHEMGHNFQQNAWTWDGTGEVTNNLFSLYASEKMNGATPATYGEAHRAMDPAAVKARLAKYLANGAHYEDWRSDPFLALSMFAELREQFGWQIFTRLFAQYWALSPSEEPRTDIDKRDQFMIRFSKLVGKNLGPFFQAWGVPTTDAARQSIADLPAWMPKDWPVK